MVERWFEDIFRIIYRIENRKAREIWSEMSDLRVARQLDAFPVSRSSTE